MTTIFTFIMFFSSSGVSKQVFIALCAYLGLLVVGYSTGWTAPVIPKLKDPALSPLSDQISDFQISLVGSILYLGSLLGPQITGYLANVKGRKPCMVLGGVCSIIAYVILSRATSLFMIYIGRFLTGSANGIIIVTSLVYLGEIASTHIRGILLTGIGIFVTGGNLVAFSIGPFVSYSMAGYVGAFLAFIYTTTVLWIPETPTFYALKDNENAVRNVLEDLGRIEDVDKILSPKIEESSWKDWKELFILKGNRKALGITIILNVTQHGSGLLAITFFATLIFELAGANIKPAFATIILGCAQLCGGIIAPIFVERSGRRKLLLISLGTCCLSMLFLGIYFHLEYMDYWAIERLRWLPITALIVFHVSYDFGLGIIPNAMAGEMFEPNVRSKGCGFATSISWLVGFAVTTAFGSLITIVGGDVLFWFFSVVCASTFLYTLFFVPETTGKSLKEIQELLSK